MKYFLACLLSGLINTAAVAESYKLGDLIIDKPYARSTPPLAPVGGGFMTITNNGKEADTLISGEAAFSKAFEIHEMSMQDGVMKMAELENGLVIPAGETVALKPGSYHVMFITLLTFEKAGDVEVEFIVKDILKMHHSKMKHSEMKKTDDSMPEMDHSKMKQHSHKNMSHSNMEATKSE